MSTALAQQLAGLPRYAPPVSVQDYLSLEQQSEVKHEYAAGRIFAMAGASDRHNRIAGNVYAHLWTASRKDNCSAYISDMRLRIDALKPKLLQSTSTVIYYPDVMVCCETDDGDEYFKTKPCLVMEVLSESTERIDRSEKLHNYQQIPDLQAYVLIAQDQMRVDVYRRNAEGWRFESLHDAAHQLQLSCPTIDLTLAEIYERVVF
jgi:Uma2 family endonuclease